MSLSICLTLEGVRSSHSGSGIFVREDGQTKEISRAKWDEKFPEREPIVLDIDQEGEVYSANITHNLNSMASKAGIYKHLWRPDEIDVTKGWQLIEPLGEGLNLLRSDPKRFKKFNPKNGWGNYEGLVAFVENYLAACETYPDAEISVWR